MSFYIALTTINEPTWSVLRLTEIAEIFEAQLVVAGDAEGPDSFECKLNNERNERVTFLSLDSQKEIGFSLGRALPSNHYARKNMAYLHAINGGATCVYETDDDNAPLESWEKREETTKIGRRIAVDDADSDRWINVYRYFSQENIWPRGFPLDEVQSVPPEVKDVAETVNAPIQQGLVNRMPDVDAVWRLTQNREVFFEDASSVLLSPGNWCPFNTQSTWWWPVAFPLLYVPSYCTFRVCDIWKSFIAQRCLWEIGSGVVFHSAEVEQDRNIHNPLTDFSQEIPGYLQNKSISHILTSVMLRPGSGAVGDNLRLCYQTLVEAEIFSRDELDLVDLWLEDLRRCKITGT